ncbi:mechanosensitive ion channel family protein [Candidatus Altiarchaeota archaeon]
MADITLLLGKSIAGNLVSDYLLSFIVFLGALLTLIVFKRIVLKRLDIIAKKTKNDLDDLLIALVQSINKSFYILLSLYFAIQFIRLPGILDRYVAYAVFLVAVYYLVLLVVAVIEYMRDRLVKKSRKEGRAEDISIIKNLSNLFKYVTWVLAFMLILDNMGYNISALIAGVGIGGIAIAFALQNILEDIFSSISIHLDKPFKLGDFIVIGDDLGEVKKIGVKSTRIQTLQGEELVVSNKELTSTRIHNFKKMQKRRIGFTFGVTYGTPAEKMALIPKMLEAIISNTELCVFDRCHFKKFGDFSLEFEVIYFIDSNDYLAYMNAQQSMNLELMKRFAKEGIEFAFPTQTILLEKQK